MFDLGFSELLLTGIVALVVLGPERLPKAARTAGRWLGKLQRFAADMKGEINRQIEQAELAEVKDDFASAVREVRDGLQSPQYGDRPSESPDADEDLPAWERLPPQRTPADFGLDGNGRPLDVGGAFYDCAAPVHMVTLRRQAMNRRRDLRPRHRPQPQLRVRRQRGRLKGAGQ